MAQIIPQETIAGSLGQGLGAGLGKGLEALAQQKMQQMAKRQEQAETFALLKKNPLISDEGAQFLSGLDPQSRQAFIGNMQFPSEFFYKQPQTQQNASEQTGLQQVLGSAQEQQQQQSQQTNEVQRVLQMLSDPGQAAQLLSLTGLGALPQSQQQMPQIPQPAALLPQGSAAAQQAPQQQQTAPNLIKPFEKPEDRRHREAMAQKEQIASRKERVEAFKATKEERQEILSSARKAQQDLKDLDRLEELEKEGKLNTPGYVEFLHRTGLDIPALMNPGSEEYQKIAANFMRGVKDYTRGNITNFELEQFLKTIPSLSQSPEGRSRVIANLKRLKRSEIAYKDAYKEVLARNKGIPPLDLSEQIDDVIEPRLEALALQFKKDLLKSVPKGQNKYITALQAGTGSLLGRLPKAAAGAGLGALGGARFGPIGAGIGAGLGGLAGLGGYSIKDLI